MKKLLFISFVLILLFNLPLSIIADEYSQGYDDGYLDGYLYAREKFANGEPQNNISEEDTTEDVFFDYFRKVAALANKYSHINLLVFSFWSSLLSLVAFCIARYYCLVKKAYESINTLDGLSLFSIVFWAHTILLIFFSVTNIENYSYISSSLGKSFLHGLTIFIPCLFFEGCVLFLLLFLSLFLSGSSDPLKVFCFSSYAILALFFIVNFLYIVQTKHYYSMFPIFSQLIALLIPSIVVWYKNKKEHEYDYLYK